MENAGSVHRHWTIEVDRYVLNRSLRFEQMQVIQQFLRASDRKRRNDYHAAPFEGAVDDLRELVRGVGWVVAAVAVCGLDHQIIGLPDGGRRMHDRIVLTPEVPGEQNTQSGVPELDDRGAKDMAGTRKPQYQSATQIDMLVEGYRRKPRQAAPCVVLGVERQRGRVLGESAPVCQLRLFLVQVPGVGQKDLAQILRGAATENLATKAVFHEERQIAAVVYVRVGKDDRFDRTRIDRQALPVPKAQLLETLEQPAVHQDTPRPDADQVLRARNRAGSAEESQLHWVLISCSSARRVPQVVLRPRIGMSPAVKMEIARCLQRARHRVELTVVKVAPQAAQVNG